MTNVGPIGLHIALESTPVYTYTHKNEDRVQDGQCQIKVGAISAAASGPFPKKAHLKQTMLVKMHKIWSVDPQKNNVKR